MKGVYLTQSYPTLRHLSSMMSGAYNGRTDEERYFVDVIADIVSDCEHIYLNSF